VHPGTEYLYNNSYCSQARKAIQVPIEKEGKTNSANLTTPRKHLIQNTTVMFTEATINDMCPTSIKNLAKAQ
jgi:hypothetical protein